MQTELTIEVRVRYPECDPMGVLHHSRYFVYFEMARMELFRNVYGDYRALEAQGIFFVVANAECKYLRPAHYDDLLQVTVHVTKVSRVKIVQEYTITRDTEVISRGKITLAMVNREGQVILIPDEYLMQ